MIKHRKSTPSHPRTNGQTEKTNGILCKIITKTVQGSNTDWDQRVFDALWAYRTAYKLLQKVHLSNLFMGKRLFLPIELEIPSLRIAIDHRMSDLNSLRHRYAVLEKLNET
jgi:hypothetical protein